MRKKTGILAIAIIVTIAWVILVVAALFCQWSVQKDTVSWLDRAQVASNPEDMQEYLIKCKDGMETRGLTHGYAAIIWKTPENYMPLIIEALDKSTERCNYMKQFNETSIEYQVALDDVRGQIRELDLHTPYSWWVKHLFFYLMAIFLWIPALIFWFWWSEIYY